MSQPTQPTIAKKPGVFSMDRIMDAWCCFFLAAGLLAALFRLFYPGPPFPWDFLYFPALCLLLLFFLSASPRDAIITSYILILLVLVSGSGKWLDADFIRWWAAGFTPANYDYVQYFYVVARLLMAGGITLALWLLLRRRAPFWLFLLACPAVVAVLAYFGWRGFTLSMYLLAAGLLPLAAAAMFKRARPLRGRAAVYALPLTVLILGAALLILPPDTGAWRWQPWGDKVEEWREQARVVYWGWRNRKEPLPAFDLLTEYYAFLGGPIDPGGERMLLVEASEPLLLKGSAYDFYTGHGWIKGTTYYNLLYTQEGGDLEAFRYHEQSVPFTADIADDDLAQIVGFAPAAGSAHPLSPYVRPFRAEITLLHPLEPRLFFGGRPESFFSDFDIEPYLARDSGELRAQQPLYSGYSYELSGKALDRNKEGFAAAMAEAPLWQGDGANMLRHDPFGFTRKLPQTLVLDEGFVPAYQLTKGIVGAGLEEGERRSPYEQALLLERWLKENCQYTLTPEMPPPERDFALYFLETRQGYCTYYATAMVVMARMLDMQARYVTGYSLLPLRGENRYEATQATAHAWAELYFEGVGWLPFDPTGQALGGLLNPGATTLDPEYERPIPGGQVGGGAEPPPLDYRILWPYALALVLGLAAALIIMLRWTRLAYSLPKLRARFSPGAVLDIYYSDLLGQLEKLGWQRRPSETVLAFAQRMGGYFHFPYQTQQLRELAAAISAWRYGGLPPQEESLLNASSLHEYFEERLRQELRRDKYFLFRLKHRPKEV